MPHSILLTHGNTARKFWYGGRAVQALNGVADVILNEQEDFLAPDALVAKAGGCPVVILDRHTPLTSYEMERLPDLVAIVRSGVDTRHIDIEAASALGILVTRTDAGYVASTAELVLTHILSAARRLPRYIGAFHDGEVASPVTGREMKGSTVGLIGHGRIARHLAGILVAMGVKVLVHDPYSEAEPPVENCDLARLFETSDFVVPLVTVSEETTNIVDAAAFSRMKKDAWLVNCSRGEVVDEDALIEALDKGMIAGAALDVGRDDDQLPSRRLMGRANVHATPHIGNLTVEAAERQPLQTVEQVRSILRGDVPHNSINIEKARRFKHFADSRQVANL